MPDLAALADAVARAASAAPLLQALSPLNWEAETERLLRCRRAGGRLEPSFIYAPPRPGLLETARALDEVADALDALGPVGRQLAARAREGSLELRLAAEVGRPSLAALARERFCCAPGDDARAAGWAALARETEEEPSVLSCDERDPRSLLSAMRRAVGERRLPVRVVVRADMAPLAAAGEGVVFVAARRLLSERDVRRTVLHELDGHVLPSLARRALGPLAALRPARGADAEEGHALLLEQHAGFLDRRRRRELGLRHAAARMAHDEAPFADIVARLEAWDAPPAHAIRIAARAARGGGLGRERVYLPWLWRLRSGTPLPGPLRLLAPPEAPAPGLDPQRTGSPRKNASSGPLT